MVKSWKSSELYIGNVAPRQKVVITFVCADSLSDVIWVRGSCSCTQCVVEGDTIVVTYKAKDIPIHLLSAGTYKARGSVKVFYANGLSDVLTFYGEVSK